MNSLLAANIFVVVAALLVEPPAAPPAAPDRQEKAADRVAEIIADRLPQLHGSAVWRQKIAIQADITVEIHGKLLLDGTLTYETNRRRARFDLKDGGSFVFDGFEFHVLESTIAPETARQHLELWPRVLALPFLLRERDVTPTQHRMMYLKGAPYDSIRLVHRGSDGKETDQWRIVFSGIKDHLIHGVANVPLGAFVPNADAKGRYAIMIDDYTDVEGVKLATKWTLWNWNSDLIGESLGNVTVSNIKFVVPGEAMFAKPVRPVQTTPKETSDRNDSN